MSLRNGKRARFHLQRRARTHKRMLIRELRKSLKKPETASPQGADASGI
jgi:hypothetical protein